MLSLADAIITNNQAAVLQYLRHGITLNEIDEYGFTPLIQTAIMDNMEFAVLLIQHGANPNLQDVTGGTALHWAVENNNIPFCKFLLEHGADPNLYNFSGQPPLVMPILRHQTKLRQFLIKSGADLTFAQDYINTKLLGHLFELVGTASIVSPKNEFAEVDFEGFYLEFTLGLIARSLSEFQNHFAARKLRRYSGLSQFIVEVLLRASELIKYHHYRSDLSRVENRIDDLLGQDPLIIPVGYEGHAITFIRYGDIWVKCDRREDSRHYDNVMFYRIQNMNNLTFNFIKSLIYVKQSDEFINEGIEKILNLQPLTELKIEAQVSGNCSWANVEATIPALFLLVLLQVNSESQAQAYYKTLALNYFHRWREWGKERAIQYCIQRFKEGDSIRKACHAEILAAILFQRCDTANQVDRERIETILSLLIKSPYEYILRNYLNVYYYKTYTEEGKRFANLLEEYGFKVSK